MGWGWAAAVLAAAYVAAKLMEVLWWRPRRVEEHFARQGIRGPRYRFFVGCVREMVALMVAASAAPMPRPYRSHNVLPRVLAFYHHWRKIYGTRPSIGCVCVRSSLPVAFSLLCLDSPDRVQPLFPPQLADHQFPPSSPLRWLLLLLRQGTGDTRDRERSEPCQLN